MNDENVKEWAAEVLSSLKRYTFNSVNPKTPQKVDDADVDVVGVSRTVASDDDGNPVMDKDGNPAYDYRIVGQDARGFFEIDKPDSTSSKYAMNGYFTSEANAINAAKLYFNSAVVDKINELKAKKSELEKEIEELEKELQDD